METSKVVQVEHDICNDIPRCKSSLMQKRQKLKRSLNDRGIKERVDEFELWLNLINRKLMNLYESMELLEMIEYVKTRLESQLDQLEVWVERLMDDKRESVQSFQG